MEVELSHSLEDAASSLSMGFWVQRGDEKVIHIDDKPSFHDHISGQVIHESLEYGRGVAETKEHDGRFEKSLVSDEGSLPLMAIFDVNIVVPPSNIELGKMMNIFQLVYEIRNKGEGVGITGGMLIEVLVVVAGTKFPVFLLDKEEG